MKFFSLVLTTLALALALCAVGMIITLRWQISRGENQALQLLVTRAERWLHLDHDPIRAVDLEVFSRLEDHEERLRALEGLPPLDRNPIRAIDIQTILRLDNHEARLRKIEGLPPIPGQPFDRPE